MVNSAGSTAYGVKADPRNLPSTDQLLRLPDCVSLLMAHGHTLVASEARGLLAELRAQALAGELVAAAVESSAIGAALRARVALRLAPRMRAVLNLTGTVIHTNLGRSLLADSALTHLVALMSGPNNLEFDLATGKRGDRDSIVEELLCTLTGAEAATIVNNNAAAVLLTIAASASFHEGGREVVISRGELVEIGGAFRMPDVMASAGARMIEVGTSNRTHLRDYEQAINERTALVMKVHPSNYVVQGFTSAVGEADLSAITRQRGVPLATDLGSGSLIDLTSYGLPHEPLPKEMLIAGCDVVTFSGDKLRTRCDLWRRPVA